MVVRLHPAQAVVLGFVAAIAVFTLLLMLPVATESGQAAPFRVALFTAVSAVCVTGHIVVDTPEYWSTFGEAAILGGIQIGGFGIMTLASVLGLLVSRRLGLRTRLLASAETKTLDLGAMKRVVRGVFITTVLIESGVALLLFLRLFFGYGEQAQRAWYVSVFHAVSSFNNAGFSLYSDNLMRFAADPWICWPIIISVILGGIGFPVLFEFRRELGRPRRWSLHTKLVVLTTGMLLFGGWIVLTAFEWTNPKTLGPMDVPGKLLAGFFASTTSRTVGFNTIDYSQVHETTLLTTDVLMFIGGSPGSTAGGIKVTTFIILFFAILAEARGDTTVDVFSRRVSAATLRQALTVALLGVAMVVVGTLTVLATSGMDLDRVLFEVVSATGTVGLSTGITADLPGEAQYVLIVLMFLGRLGPTTVASALALRERQKLYNYPEERPIVG